MNTASTPPTPGELWSRLLDDAAIFPPGNLPLDQAVTAHLHHQRGPHSSLVGPLVAAANDLPQLAQITASPTAMTGHHRLELAVTALLPHLGNAVDVARGVPRSVLSTLEVALPDYTRSGELINALEAALGDTQDLTVFVEVPRDERREAVLRELAGTGYFAKFRTGGVQAHLYPDEHELAAGIGAAVRNRVPFKMTAGLHHAVRNTDAQTGFEQHGLLNVLLATHAAQDGAQHPDLVRILADRDTTAVAEHAALVPVNVRAAFCSVGTCSIDEPVEELTRLGLLPALAEGRAALAEGRA